MGSWGPWGRAVGGRTAWKGRPGEPQCQGRAGEMGGAEQESWCTPAFCKQNLFLLFSLLKPQQVLPDTFPQHCFPPAQKSLLFCSILNPSSCFFFFLSERIVWFCFVCIHAFSITHLTPTYLGNMRKQIQLNCTCPVYVDFYPDPHSLNPCCSRVSSRWESTYAEGWL